LTSQSYAGCIFSVELPGVDPADVQFRRWSCRESNPSFYQAICLLSGSFVALRK